MSESRIGPWLITYTGKRFYPFDPRVEDIDINDIAHSLSQQARFGGHGLKPYSVAQHCVLVSQLCRPENALWGLLHDASEAYLLDLPSPLKHAAEFEFYRKLEKQVMLIVCEAFGLPEEKPADVNLADKKMQATEARDLTMTEGRGWSDLPDPYDFVIKTWPQDYAKTKFLSALHELTRARHWVPPASHS